VTFYPVSNVMPRKLHNPKASIIYLSGQYSDMIMTINNHYLFFRHQFIRTFCLLQIVFYQPQINFALTSNSLHVRETVWYVLPYKLVIRNIFSWLNQIFIYIHWDRLFIYLYFSFSRRNIGNKDFHIHDAN